MIDKKIPQKCPSCGSDLEARAFSCHNCNTTVEGSFSLPLLSRLESSEQEFILNFLAASGSLKELARHYRVSYPTVRNRLDALRDKVKTMQMRQSKEGKND